MATIDNSHDGPGEEDRGSFGSFVDVKNMGDTYHRPDQKTLQAKDMAIKLRIDSIQSTNTAGSGYVCRNFLPKLCSLVKLASRI